MSIDNREVRNVSLHLLSMAEAKREEARKLLREAQVLADEASLIQAVFERMEISRVRREIVAEHGPKAKHQLVLKRHVNGSFEVDEPSLPGSPAVGRGDTAMSAFGDWFFNYREKLGCDFDFDPSAADCEELALWRKATGR